MGYEIEAMGWVWVVICNLHAAKVFDEMPQRRWMPKFEEKRNGKLENNMDVRNDEI